MFIINCINRFIVRGQVIDKAIESDMRAEKNEKEQRLAEERRLGVERKKGSAKTKNKIIKAGEILNSPAFCILIKKPFSHKKKRL